MAHSVNDPLAVQLGIVESLQRRGWAVFPVLHGDKLPAGKWTLMSENVPTADMLQTSEWFGVLRNIGIACGPSNLVIIDEDRYGAFTELAARLHRELPTTYTVETGKGRHFYFEAPDDVRITNSSGQLKQYGIDVRGAGGYVVAEGSLHPNGNVYRAMYPWEETRALPEWVIDMILERGEPTSVSATTLAPPQKSISEHTPFTRAQAQEYCHAPLERAIHSIDGEQNNRLNDYAFSLGHFTSENPERGFYSAAEAQQMCLEVARQCGYYFRDAQGADKTIRSGLIAGMNDPYLMDMGSPYVAEEPVEDLTPEEIAERRHASLVATERERLQIHAEARRLLDVEGLPPLMVLDASEFLAAPMPEFLVSGFLYRASTAKVYGPPGGTKSFFLLDIALHLATGRSWHGRRLPRTKVHYVMAEGQAVNTLRTLGWLEHHDVDPGDLQGWFTAIPQGILLTPEGVDQYLAVVNAEQPGLVILDTKNRMMAGEENSASDVAVMIRAMDAIREASQACVCLVDHTGLADQSRGRGSNAVTAAMDSEIRVGVTEGIACAEVTRDKAGLEGTKVNYQLIQVDNVPTPPGVSQPAVCEPLAATVTFNNMADEARRTWADPDLWFLPEDVLKIRGNGKMAVPDVARYMRWAARDPRGAGRSRGEMVKEVRKLGTYTNETVLINAWDLLLKAGRVQNLNQGSKSKTVASHWIELDGDPEPGA